MKNLSDASVLKSIYFSLFQSHETYGLVAWGSSPKCLNRVYLSQKRAIRAISGLDFNDPTSASFKSLRILKIFDLYILLYIILENGVLGFIPTHKFLITSGWP